MRGSRARFRASSGLEKAGAARAAQAKPHASRPCSPEPATPLACVSALGAAPAPTLHSARLRLRLHSRVDAQPRRLAVPPPPPKLSSHITCLRLRLDSRVDVQPQRLAVLLQRGAHTLLPRRRGLLALQRLVRAGAGGGGEGGHVGGVQEAACQTLALQHWPWPGGQPPAAASSCARSPVRPARAPGRASGCGRRRRLPRCCAGAGTRPRWRPWGCAGPPPRPPRRPPARAPPPPPRPPLPAAPASPAAAQQRRMRPR